MADTDDIQSEDLISQDDIDQLLQGIEEIGEAEAASLDGLDTEDLVSQDEIDKLLGLSDVDEEFAGDSSPDEEEAELISQDDIDMLLKGMEDPEDAGDDVAPVEEAPYEEFSAEDEDLEMISMEDIESLFESDVQDFGGESAAPEADFPEEESLISQDDIDSLLAGTDSDSPSASDDLSELLGDSSDSAGEEESLITQDDIDSLLNEAVADEAFAGEAGDGLGNGSADLVSQEDIDRLLKGDMEEGEVPAEEIPQSPDAEPVILENADDEDLPAGEKKSGNGKKWYKSLKVLIAASVVLLLSVSGTLFFLFRGGEEPDFEAVVPAEQVETEIAEAPVLDEPAFNFARGEKMTSTLTGFIVPAPLKMKGVSFIAADISIEFIDVSSDPLKGYEPFFRNIIYDVLRKALVLNDKSLIVEADLKRMIEKAVNDALTEGAVEKVDFIMFKIG